MAYNVLGEHWKHVASSYHQLLGTAVLSNSIVQRVSLFGMCPAAHITMRAGKLTRILPGISVAQMLRMHKPSACSSRVEPRKLHGLILQILTGQVSLLPVSPAYEMKLGDCGAFIQSWDYTFACQITHIVLKVGSIVRLICVLVDLNFQIRW